jgi:hypothetical protein
MNDVGRPLKSRQKGVSTLPPSGGLQLSRDPVDFIERYLHDPETEQPFQLTPAEKTFLRAAFELKDGRLPHPELVFSGPKKSGKTALAAMVAIYTIVVHGGKYGEAYCIAND